MIRNSKDTYCADLTGTGAVARASHVTESLCYPGLGDNQMWSFQKRPGGYWIRNYVSNGFCPFMLGVNGAVGKQAPLIIVQCDPMTTPCGPCPEPYGRPLPEPLLRRERATFEALKGVEPDAMAIGSGREAFRRG